MQTDKRPVITEVHNYNKTQLGPISGSPCQTVCEIYFDNTSDFIRELTP